MYGPYQICPIFRGIVVLIEVYTDIYFWASSSRVEYSLFLIRLTAFFSFTQLTVVQEFSHSFPSTITRLIQQWQCGASSLYRRCVQKNVLRSQTSRPILSDVAQQCSWISLPRTSLQRSSSPSQSFRLEPIAHSQHVSSMNVEAVGSQRNKLASLNNDHKQKL